MGGDGYDSNRVATLNLIGLTSEGKDGWLTQITNQRRVYQSYKREKVFQDRGDTTLLDGPI